MAVLGPTTGHSYSAVQAMPQPAIANGPWGEAIRYWLSVRKLRQADLARPVSKGGTGLRANTISRVTRGFDTTTRVLRRIATALDIPLDQLLVSPQRHHESEDRRRLAIEIAERVLRTLEQRDPYNDRASAIETLARQALEQEHEQQHELPPPKAHAPRQVRKARRRKS